ncbi:MAG: amylo-alpha-1,6-glucosidase [Bacteroidales bacterium]|jgi:predicted glycogen debranching enzyme|nr:amylo-alpha-1,6-glucosidase [Bacteroidales bacterium]
MAYLNFNKAELVNLEYSLKRELIMSNRVGAYLNTTAICCNTRKYHGLLVVPVPKFGNSRYVLLSALDETLIQHGREFNLGIHKYGNVFEPRGHKYICDLEVNKDIAITYRVGGIVFRKSMILAEDREQVLIKYTLVDAHSDTVLRLKPYLAFRSIHTLTKANGDADTHYVAIDNGRLFKMYEGFPDLCLQLSKQCEYVANPDWYYNVEYMDEARRGFPCREDLFVPGFFEVPISKGETVVFSASLDPVKPEMLFKQYSNELRKTPARSNYESCLKSAAHQLIINREGRAFVCSGFSWMGVGVLRDTCVCLPGLTLYNDGNVKLFEKVMSDLTDLNANELFVTSDCVDAPLRFAILVQHHASFTCDPKRSWKLYGDVVKRITESYLAGREEVHADAGNGLLWAQKPGVALSWMDAYTADGKPVTERAGYQVETNCIWYNDLRFAADMESRYGSDLKFVRKCSETADKLKDSFFHMFWYEKFGHLADVVGENGTADGSTRPNQLYACCLEYSPVNDETKAIILDTVKNDLLTTRGIRTLSPKNPLYKGVYEGNQKDRDLAYHNGTSRVWLLGPYIAANFKLRGKLFVNRAEQLADAFAEDLTIHGVGSVAELYDGNPPHNPHGAISSATAIAVILRAKYLIDKYKHNK